MDEEEIGRRLDEGKAAVDQSHAATVLRREAVMLAHEHGWSKYKIAARLKVKGPTVDAIIEYAERAKAKAARQVKEQTS